MTFAPFVGSQPVALGLCATSTPFNAVADRIQSRPAACTYRRIDCSWWANQHDGPPGGTQPGGWDTLTSDEMDTTVNAAAKAGKKLVLCPTYSPIWAGGNGTDGHNYPQDAANGYRDFANFVYVAASRCEKRHPGTVIAWEIWNEPNSNFLAPASVANYGLMLETAYILFRTGVLLGRVNRTPLPTTVQVWSGGTGAAAPVGSPFRHLNWSRSLLQRPVRCLDGVGIHAYSGGCPLGTANNYDPATNDIPGIHDAVVACTWPGANTLQIHDTESGYFHRDDGTLTKTNDPPNCGSYGAGPNPNEKLEVTVTTAASRLTSHWVWWKAHAVQYGLGLSFYYQQDTTAGNNTGAGVWANHAGLYQYDPARNGAPTVNGAGQPALVDAFVATQKNPVPTPPLNFPGWAATGAHLTSTAEMDAALAANIEGLRVGFIDWDSSDPTFAGTFTPKQAHIDAIKQMQARGLGIILQTSLGATFGGKLSNGDFGQGYNHTGRDHDSNGNPIGPVVDVPVQFSKFIVNFIKYFDGSTANRPLVTMFEIMNEANHFRFDDGIHSGVTVGQKGAAYLEYLVRIYPEVKAARPDAIIITTGLGGDKATASDRPADLFTQDLFTATFTLGPTTYSMATHKLFDRYCWHPYDGKALPSRDDNDGWFKMIETQAWLADNGFCDVKFIVSEAGAPTPIPPDGTYTLQDSANWIYDAMTEWNRYPWGGGAGMPFCYFSLTSNTEGQSKGKDTGIYDLNLVPNGARFDAIKAVYGNRNANPPPSVLCFSPTTGPLAGGTTLTVHGSFLSAALPLGFSPGFGIPSHAEFDAYLAAGATQVRLDLRWDSVDPNMDGIVAAGGYNNLDNAITYCDSIGLDIWLLASGGTNDMNLSAVIPNYAKYVANLAEHLDGVTRVVAIECGNEVDAGPWGQTQPPYGQFKGQAYAEIMIRLYDPAYEDVKSRSDRPIFAGSTARADPLTHYKEAHGRGANPDPVVYVSGTPFPDGMRGHYDGICFHPYDNPRLASEWSTRLNGGTYELTRVMKWLKDPVSAGGSGFGDVPDLAVTEYGYTTYDAAGSDTPATLAAQAASLADLVTTYRDLATTNGWTIAAFCWLEFMDKPRVGADDKAWHWGIVTTTGTFPIPAGSKKPAYAAYTTAVTAAAGVTVGGVACTNVVVAADGESLTCVTPAHTVGVVPLVVTNVHGASAPLDFQFAGTTAGIPIVTSLTPATGPFTGANHVVIAGTFTGVDPLNPTAVKFGTIPASFSLDSGSQITATVPTGLPGRVNVTVTNPTGTSTIGPGSRYTFTSTAPVVQLQTVRLADGTVYADLTSPVPVSGIIAVAWSATDDIAVSDTWIETSDGTFLATGAPGGGLYGCTFDTALLANGADPIVAVAVDGENQKTFSTLATLLVDNSIPPPGRGLFAVPFYHIYTIPGHEGDPPNVAILSATPNPLTAADTELTLVFQADQAGDYVVSVANATVGAGTVTALEVRTVVIPRTSFVDGVNVLTVTVTNANGSGLASISITRGEVTSGLCWAGPLVDDEPREEVGADPLANALGRHMRQPLRARDVFILLSGAVVEQWITPDDPIRVALWGASPGQHVSEGDAQLLIDAGYQPQLVACVQPVAAGWDTGGWDTGPWDA